MILQKPKYILFNGPASSGKTTLADEAGWYLRRYKSVDAKSESFALPMKQFLSFIFGTPYNYIDKDSVHDLLGTTPRQFLIDLSENYMKKVYGDDIFGRALRARTTRPAIYVLDDSGFDAEMRALPRDDVFIIRIVRPGFDFRNDSRGYLSSPDYTLFNDGDLEKARSVTRDIMNDIINKIEADSETQALTQSTEEGTPKNVQANPNQVPSP